MALKSQTGHSRIVAWSKIVLPLAALAILSSLFLFSKTNDPSKGVRLFDGDLAEFASKERITKPRFAGMTPAGTTIEVSADHASPRETGGPSFDAEDIQAHIVTADGRVIDIIAPRGSIDSIESMAELSGGISLETSGGFLAKTQGLTFALDRLDIRSLGEITAEGPLGFVRAGSMVLKLSSLEESNEDQGFDLVFKNGIKLIYKP